MGGNPDAVHGCHTGHSITAWVIRRIGFCVHTLICSCATYTTDALHTSNYTDTCTPDNTLAGRWTQAHRPYAQLAVPDGLRS